MTTVRVDHATLTVTKLPSLVSPQAGQPFPKCMWQARIAALFTEQVRIPTASGSHICVGRERAGDILAQGYSAVEATNAIMKEIASLNAVVL